MLKQKLNRLTDIFQLTIQVCLGAFKLNQTEADERRWFLEMFFIFMLHPKNSGSHIHVICAACLRHQNKENGEQRLTGRKQTPPGGSTEHRSQMKHNNQYLHRQDQSRADHTQKEQQRAQNHLKPFCAPVILHPPTFLLRNSKTSDCCVSDKEF